MSKLVPYFKLVNQEKLASHLKAPEEYDALFTKDEIDKLFREMVSYYIDPEKCQACMTCLRRCPAEAIVAAKTGSMSSTRTSASSAEPALRSAPALCFG